MKLTKATTSTGEVHVLEGKTSIAVFEKEIDADLFIQAKRAATAPLVPKDFIVDQGQVEPPKRWIASRPCFMCGEHHSPFGPCPHTLTWSGTGLTPVFT